MMQGPQQTVRTISYRICAAIGLHGPKRCIGKTSLFVDFTFLALARALYVLAAPALYIARVKILGLSRRLVGVVTGLWGNSQPHIERLYRANLLHTHF